MSESQTTQTNKTQINHNTWKQASKAEDFKCKQTHSNNSKKIWRMLTSGNERGVCVCVLGDGDSGRHNDGERGEQWHEGLFPGEGAVNEPAATPGTAFFLFSPPLTPSYALHTHTHTFLWACAPPPPLPLSTYLIDWGPEAANIKGAKCN